MSGHVVFHCSPLLHWGPLMTTPGIFTWLQPTRTGFGSSGETFFLLSLSLCVIAHIPTRTNMSGDPRMHPSTIPKSISVPQLRQDIQSHRLRNQVSTSSAQANLYMANPNREAGPSHDEATVEIDLGETTSKNGKGQRHVHFSDQLSPAVCRICHGGEVSCPFNNGEPLISPCHCTGSMGLYHRSCLEKWLSTSNTDQCEICKFQYIIERYPKPLTEFVCNPGSRSIRRNMIGDILCLFVLTPMAIASCWLCIAGALAVAQSGSDAIAVPGLISLALFLLVTYLIWLSFSLRYHCQVWRDWRNVNQRIRLVTPEGKADGGLDEEGDNNNDSPREMVQLQPLASMVGRRPTDTNLSSPWPRSEGHWSRGAFVFDYPNPAFVWDTVV